MSLFGYALPRLDSLVDEGLGQGVCDIGSQLGSACVAYDLDNTAASRGHNL